LSEIYALREAQTELQDKLTEANRNCSTAHISIASIVAEKERLVKENQDLSRLCEEVMAELEARNT
jgi:hypothetical protein